MVKYFFEFFGMSSEVIDLTDTDKVRIETSVRYNKKDNLVLESQRIKRQILYKVLVGNDAQPRISQPEFFNVLKILVTVSEELKNEFSPFISVNGKKEPLDHKNVDILFDTATKLFENLERNKYFQLRNDLFLGEKLTEEVGKFAHSLQKFFEIEDITTISSKVESIVSKLVLVSENLNFNITKQDILSICGLSLEEKALLLNKLEKFLKTF